MILVYVDIPEKQRTVLCIVLEKDNLDRMREGDPVTLESPDAGGLLRRPRFPEGLSILVAYLEDSAEFYEIADKNVGNPRALLRYLEKKRQWRPEVDGVANSTNLKDFGKHSA
jgi:hypothetical protein